MINNLSSAHLFAKKICDLLIFQIFEDLRNSILFNLIIFEILNIIYRSNHKKYSASDSVFWSSWFLSSLSQKKLKISSNPSISIRFQYLLIVLIRPNLIRRRLSLKTCWKLTTHSPRTSIYTHIRVCKGAHEINKSEHVFDKSSPKSNKSF